MQDVGEGVADSRTGAGAKSGEEARTGAGWGQCHSVLTHCHMFFIASVHVVEREIMQGTR